MRIVIVNVLALLLLCSVAQAGVLATDPNALFYDGTLWSGSTVMELDALRATVDWCVYGPGQFSYPGLGYTPTSGEFVYAYQVFVEATTEVLTFSVGLLESNEANNIGTWAISGGVEPTSMGIQGTPPFEEAAWNWGSEEEEPPSGLQPGSNSVGLAYSSINAPLMYGGYIMNGGSSAVGEVPSASDVIPEPATLGLLLAGAIAAGLRRRRR